jgi:pentatricopeptide repeat protein
MTRCGTALFLLAFGALVPRSAAQDKELTLMSAYATLSPRIESAKSALRKDKPAKCEEEALYCLGKLPEHQEAHFVMSQVLYKRGDYGGALEHIRAAEEGYIRMAQAIAVLDQQKTKNRSEAMDVLADDVSDLAAADATVKNRGSCLPDKYSAALQGSKEQLIREEEERGRTDRQRDLRQVPAPYRYMHGNILFRLERPAEAEAEYRQAIGKDPEFRETYNNLINLLFIGGRVDEARAVLAEAEAHKATVHPELKKAVLAR